MITSERLREFLDYDQYVGIFRWKIKICKKINVGDIAGRKSGIRRPEIRIDGKLYLASRLAWLYMVGKWPENDVDHINGNPFDNRFANLRDVTKTVNQQNQRKAHSKNNLGGFLGVSFSKKRGKFFAQIKAADGCKFLGYFTTAVDAHNAYLLAKRQLHTGCTI